MLRGCSAPNFYKKCISQGLCKNHAAQLDIQEEQIDSEFFRKLVLYVRINILNSILFNRPNQCVTIEMIMQKTKHFTYKYFDERNLPDEAYENIYVLDSIIIFTMCHLSKICCFGALFKSDVKLDSEDIDLKFLINLVHDKIKDNAISTLCPVIQKEFPNHDIGLIKVCYATVLFFIRTICTKISILDAVQSIEKDLNDSMLVSKAEREFVDQGRRLCGELPRDIFEGEIMALTAALKYKSPYSYEIFTLRSRCYKGLKLYQEALLDCYISTMLNPSCETFKEMGSILEQLNDFQTLHVVTLNCFAWCKDKFKCEYSAELVKMCRYSAEGKENGFVKNIKGAVENNNNVPELIEASDSSDSDWESTGRKIGENIPELIEASDTSDSDEEHSFGKEMEDSKSKCSTPTKSKRKVKQRKKVAEQFHPPVETEETLDFAKINEHLKEASDALLEDCGYKALQLFCGKLKKVIESLESHPFKEPEVVCIKYSYGLAYCQSGGYEDLQKSLVIFQEIIEKHESVPFAAAYYALGLSYRKLNRFKDALTYLKTVKSMLEKGIRFKVYPWPAHTSVINETKSKVLVELVDNLIKECESPPNPEAVCRFSECAFHPPIYYSDPDFKGYISLFCSEQCCLQYHLQCWKTIKTEKELTEKEFLERPCFTPDCDGVLTKVQSIDRKGDVCKEFASEVKKGPKTKWAKWEKKKEEVKDKKKKKTHNTKTESNTQENENEKDVPSRKNSDATESSISSLESSVPAIFNPPKATTAENVKEPVDAPKLINAPYLLHNGEIIDVSDMPVNIKKAAPEVSSIEKEKNLKPNENNGSVPLVFDIKSSTHLPSVQSIPATETVQESKSVVEENESKTHVPDTIKKNTYIQPTQILPEIFSSDKDSESLKISDKSSKSVVSKTIKSNLLLKMLDFLQIHGPLKFDDPLLIKEMKTYPEDAIEMIESAGGIGNFLKNDLRFAFVQDTYICVIGDLGAAYKLCSNPLHIYENDDLEYPEYSSCDIDEDNTSIQNYSLNPNAREYKPNNSSNASFQSDTSISSPVQDTKIGSESRQSVSPITIKSFEPIMENEKRASGDSIENSKVETFSPPISMNKSSSEEIKSSPEKITTSEDPSISSETDLKKNDADCIGIKLRALLGLYFSPDMENYRQVIDQIVEPFVVKRKEDCKNDATEKTVLELRSKLVAVELNEYQLKLTNEVLTEQRNLLMAQLNAKRQQKEAADSELSALRQTVEDISKTTEVQARNFESEKAELQNGRTFLLESLSNSHQTIDKQKEELKKLYAENKNLKKTIDEQKECLKNNENKLTHLTNEDKKHKLDIKALEAENSSLREKLQKTDMSILHLKKTELVKKIDDKTLEATKKQKELSDGLSLMMGNLSPIMQANMKTLASQLSNYIDELAAIKLDAIYQIDDQIERVKNGELLVDLPSITIKDLPELPSFEKLCPAPTTNFNKTVGPPQIQSQFGLNTSSLPPPGIFAALAPPVVPNVITPPAPVFAPVAPPVITSPVPPIFAPLTTVPPVKPPIIRAKRMIKGDNMIDPKDPQNFKPDVLQDESFKSAMASFNCFANPTMPTPALSNGAKRSIDSVFEPNLTLNPPTTTSETFQATSMTNVALPTRPITKTPLLELATAKDQNNLGISASSETSIQQPTRPIVKTPLLETPAAAMEEKSLASAVPKPTPTLEPKKSSSKSSSNNYEKLLEKLREQFPSHTSEELMCCVSEFRKQRQGKLSGLPIDTIISHIGAIINSKRANEKKIFESKMMSNKSLVNKKLAPDPNPPKPPKEECSKKKIAWKVSSDSTKPWSGDCDESCVICHEDMSRNSYKVQCGHMFHERCIKQWLTKKMDCPICRVLLLLPEDYPSLS